MAWNTDITLRDTSASNDITLREMPVASIASTIIFMAALAASPADIVLRDTTVAPGGGSFPTQFAGLRTFYSGAVKELCLVATADAPGSMGASPRIRKGVTDYAVYLVETGDANASHVYIRTSAGTKAVRIKT